MCQAHPNTPIYHDGQVYITSGYNAGGVMLKLSEDGSSIQELWKDDTLDTHHGGVILVDGHLYGANWQNNSRGKWVCLDWKTGKALYEQEWKCKGSILYAEGMLYCYEEKDGNVALVKATPEGFNPISTFQVTQGKERHWAHPVICDGRLYIRHGNVLLCYDVKAK
jgi:outer membrane protein assembly factor BamB